MFVIWLWFTLNSGGGRLAGGLGLHGSARQPRRRGVHAHQGVRRPRLGRLRRAVCKVSASRIVAAVAPLSLSYTITTHGVEALHVRQCGAVCFVGFIGLHNKAIAARSHRKKFNL